jgi:hypothetical protein
MLPTKCGHPLRTRVGPARSITGKTQYSTFNLGKEEQLQNMFMPTHIRVDLEYIPSAKRPFPTTISLLTTNRQGQGKANIIASTHSNTCPNMQIIQQVYLTILAEVGKNTHLSPLSRPATRKHDLTT